MALTGRRILITGGAGFIGSTLAERLVEDNQIILFDNLTRDALSGKPLAKHPNVRLVQGDVLDKAAVTEAMQGASHVIHCAAIAGIDSVIRSPVRTMEVNMLGSANVIQAAAAVPGLERIVCFSTSEIFGRHSFRSGEADQAVLGAVGEARWTYAVSKLAEEHLALAYHSERGLPAVVLRPFNVYGPGQVGEGAVRNFVMKALRDEEIQVHGDGTQIRAWCYIEDMVRGTLLALEHPDAVGESFNIGNPRAVVTVYGLANTVVRVLGSKSNIVFTPASGPDVDLRVPDVAKAARVLGFTAEVDLAEGIRLTGEHYR